MTSPFGVPDCPCGSGGYAGCCGALHRGARQAATAAELMRSRYSAFAVGDADYLLRTWHPRTRPDSVQLDPRHRWVGLQVLSCDAGGSGDEQGTVSYRAESVSAHGASQSMIETARFERRGRRWVYVDGVVT